jgi:hypothetical protein
MWLVGEYDQGWHFIASLVFKATGYVNTTKYPIESWALNLYT